MKIESFPKKVWLASPTIHGEEQYWVNDAFDKNRISTAGEMDDEWTLIESSNDTIVYAYGDTEMTVLRPGDSTIALTNQMIMQSISNAKYAAIDDINITITGYAMGIENMSANPVDAWNECKSIGNI